MRGEFLLCGEVNNRGEINPMSNSPERAVKSNVPWSVKGIARDARETAKGAAKREGMTVGEWLNQVIYTAGDPATTNGEIDGAQLKDLVTAIEHLSKRISTTETSGAKAVDNLARNLGGVVERVQRLERVKPQDTTQALIKRVEHLESKSTDRQRIDALKALEKAVGQVALQFDSSQRSAVERIEATETELRVLAEKVDQGGVGDPGTTASAVDFLKDAVDGMSARISRVERIASEAEKLRKDAATDADPEFVEQTGQRLRVLGDEIKRGGDHIKKLEAVIGKMATQIDGAERRSSEGVQQVAETIAVMREQFSAADEAEAEAHQHKIEEAVAAVSAKTDERIGSLQSSFDQMISRLEGVGAAARASAAATVVAPSVDLPAGDAMKALDFVDDTAGEKDPSEVSEANIDLDDAASSEDFDFDFGDDDLEAEAPTQPELQTADEIDAEETDDVLANVRNAFGFDDDATDSVSGDIDVLEETEIDSQAFTAEKDTFAYHEDDTSLSNLLEEDAVDEEEEISLDGLIADDTDQAVESEEPAKTVEEEPVDYLKAARLKAKQAAADKAAEAESKKKRLSPKQRAILAAKIRRKKAEAKAALADEQAEETAKPEVQEADDEPRGFFSSLIANTKNALPGKKKDNPDADNADTVAAEKPESSDDDDAQTTTVAKAGFVDSVKSMPVTYALGSAVILIGAAFVFLMKDSAFGNRQAATPELTIGGAAPQTAPAAATPEITQPTEIADTTDLAGGAPALKDSITDTTETLVRPRDLYLESVTALKSATSDADIANARQGIEEAAALGHPPAQLQLGEIYKSGQGVEKDLELARAWYERAANGGNVLSMHRLGVMYARGDGGTVDNNASVAWFEKAANLGLVDSQYNLGATFHPTGDGNPLHDRAKAYFWYQIAARNGDDQAGGLASGLAASMTPEARGQADSDIAIWQAGIPDPVANEIAAAS